uniref:Uncharacterized protein n=1 Tax=Spongospora subterranea TaxID=70186 RepID=A0A0H5R7H6_9EUKA|eukprot:CRZ10105.1 hypothetical protein [Spongospora subterranea]
MESCSMNLGPAQVKQFENPAVLRRRRVLKYLETCSYMVAIIVCMISLNWFMGSVVTGANRSWSAANTRRLARAFRSWRWKTFYFLPAILFVCNLIHRRFFKGVVIQLISLSHVPSATAIIGPDLVPRRHLASLLGRNHLHLHFID